MIKLGPSPLSLLTESRESCPRSRFKHGDQLTHCPHGSFDATGHGEGAEQIEPRLALAILKARIDSELSTASLRPEGRCSFGRGFRNARTVAERAQTLKAWEAETALPAPDARAAGGDEDGSTRAGRPGARMENGAKGTSDMHGTAARVAESEAGAERMN